MEIINRRAYHDYFVDETLECGIALHGNEVKSIKSGMCSLGQSWCNITGNTLNLLGMHIAKWNSSNIFDVDENRVRVLLAHRKEILSLAEKVQQKGVSIIPLKVYLVRGRVKVLIGLCRGKHNYDKRETLKNKQVDKDIARALKNRGIDR